MAEEQTVKEQRVTYGVSDAFHDLGLPDADELVAKSDLAIAIQAAIDGLGLSESEAAARMGADPHLVSQIVRGRFGDVPTERMLGYLIRLGLDVDVVIHKRSTMGPGHGALKVAYI